MRVGTRTKLPIWITMARFYLHYARKAWRKHRAADPTSLEWFMYRAEAKNDVRSAWYWILSMRHRSCWYRISS